MTGLAPLIHVMVALALAHALFSRKELARFWKCLSIPEMFAVPKVNPPPFARDRAPVETVASRRGFWAGTFLGFVLSCLSLFQRRSNSTRGRV